MAGGTYTADVLVLKKTKLGESDLILTCLDGNGSLAQMVAKGARKPGNSFSSRLELCSFAHVLLVDRPSLDIVKEAKLIEGFPRLRNNLERSTAAAPLLELLIKLAVEGGEDPRYYAMSQVALRSLEEIDERYAVMVTAAFLLKAFAFGGFAPSFNRCCVCGLPVTLTDGTLQRLSYQEGGILCEECDKLADGVLIDSAVLKYANGLLHVRFAELGEKHWHEALIYQVLSFCQMWSRVHVGAPLKSLDFLMTLALP